MKLDKYSIIIISILTATPIILHINYYETWGNNEHYYVPVNGMEVTCDMNLFQHPSNCHPINEKGQIVEWPENYSHMGKNYGGGTIDMDPDLSPSYAYDFAYGYGSLLISLIPVFASISVIFLAPYFILKRKNIPSKPYLVLILSGILLFFALNNFQQGSVPALIATLQYPDETKMELVGALIFLFWIPIICVIIAGILLYRSSLIRKWIKNEN